MARIDAPFILPSQRLSLSLCTFLPHVYVLTSKAFGLDTAIWWLGKLEATKLVHSLLLCIARRAHLGDTAQHICFTILLSVGLFVHVNG